MYTTGGILFYTRIMVAVMEEHVVYTGGSVVFDTLNHDFSKRRHNYQPSVPSHAMSMTTIPTDGAIYI